MSIVVSTDSRNVDWSKRSIGSKLLMKMGWTEGTGLGRSRQGTVEALRAVRKHDESGIGAAPAADVTGNGGWNQTTDTFAHVLKTLQSQHSSSVSCHSAATSSDGPGSATDGMVASSSGVGSKSKNKKKKKMVLAQNKVTAGHSRKMREAKDLRTKSDADMAAIFGGTMLFHEMKRKRAKRISSSDTVVTKDLKHVPTESHSKVIEETTSYPSEEGCSKLVDRPVGRLVTKKDKSKKIKNKLKVKESKAVSSPVDNNHVDKDADIPNKEKRKKGAMDEITSKPEKRRKITR